MNIKFFEVKSHELAEFVGIILGDGSIGVYKCKYRDKIKTQYRLQITLHSEDDLEYSKYINNLFHKLFEIKFHVSFRKGEKACDLRIFRKEIVEFFIHDLKIKLAPKWGRAIIPPIFTQDSFGVDVIRGYFDTDGSVIITNNNGIVYPRLEMKICPSPMQAQFVKILKKLGFNFGVYEIGKGKIRIQINGMEELLKWIQKIGFKNPKHLRKIQKIIDSGEWI